MDGVISSMTVVQRMSKRNEEYCVCNLNRIVKLNKLQARDTYPSTCFEIANN